MRIRTPKDIGAVIRDRRRTLGLDQGELAKKVGVSRLWINQVERGKPGASIGLVLRTLAIVGTEVSANAGKRPTEGTEAIVTPDINAIVEAARSKRKS